MHDPESVRSDLFNNITFAQFPAAKRAYELIGDLAAQQRDVAPELEVAKLRSLLRDFVREAKENEGTESFQYKESVVALGLSVPRPPQQFKVGQHLIEVGSYRVFTPYEIAWDEDDELWRYECNDLRGNFEDSFAEYDIEELPKENIVND